MPVYIHVPLLSAGIQQIDGTQWKFTSRMPLVMMLHFHCQLRSQVAEGRCLCVSPGKARDQVQEVVDYYNVKVTQNDIFSRCQASRLCETVVAVLLLKFQWSRSDEEIEDKIKSYMYQVKFNYQDSIYCMWIWATHEWLKKMLTRKQKYFETKKSLDIGF